MTLNTAINGLPYPELTNVKDQVAQFSAFSAVADNRYVPRYANASARDAANPSPTNGQLTYLTQERLLQGRHPAGWVTEQFPTYVRKTIPQSVTSSTTLIADSQLKLTLAANSTYFIEVVLNVTGAANTAPGGISVNWSDLASVLVSRATVGYYLSGSQTDPTLAVAIFNTPTSGNHTYGTNTSSSPVGIHENLTVTTSSSPLTATMRWAQVTSSATPTTVLANSYIKYWKIS